MKQFLLLLTLPVFFACSKDNPQVSNLSKNQTLSAACLKSEVPVDFNPQCYFDSTRSCELVDVQEFFPFSDDNKEWLKTFCLNDFDRIFFHDEDGNETFLEISRNDYSTTRTTIQSGACQTNPDQLKTYCIRTERASVEIRVPIASLSFNLSIRNIFDVDEFGKIEPSIVLEAITFEFSNVPGESKFINHLGILTDSESQFAQEFFPKIDILGKTFTNVYSSENGNIFVPSDPDALKIFYNKEFGIVSFIDNNATQWVLND